MKRKVRLMLAAVCAALLFGTGFGEYLPELAVRYPSGMTAWWGTIYPDFCFAGKTSEAEQEQGEEQKRHIKISFFLKHLLEQ